MAILDNTPLGFSEQQSCDCRSSDYSQIVAKEDNPVWQIVAECDDNVIVGDKKLPCENNQVGDYWTDFKNRNSSYAEVINTEVAFFQDYIQLTAAQNAANYIGTVDNYLTPDRFYVVRYSITGYSGGYIHLIDGAGNAGPMRQTNGTFTEIIPSGVNGRFAFRYGSDSSSTPTTTLTISNIFVGCIRISQQWDIPNILSGDITFTGQTGFCADGDTGFTMPLRDEFKSQLVIGQTYRICFTVSQQSALFNSVDFTFGLTTESIDAAGQYCFNIKYEDDVCQFVLDAGFVGCLSDIEITLSPTIKTGLFNEDDELVEDGLVTEVINNTVKVSLSPELPDGCYRVGVADSCSNFKHQFFGSVFDVETYSENITMPQGEMVISDNGTGIANSTVLFKEALCCGKTYNGQITLDIITVGEEPIIIELVTITITAGGVLIGDLEFEVDSSSEVRPFVLESGCLNGDLQFDIQVAYSTSLGTTPTTIRFNFNNPVKSYLNMDEGLFCPEFYSGPLKVVQSAPCDTLLVKYRNDNDAYGFDYSSSGYTIADGFYNQLRIEAKVWKGNFSKTKSVQKKSDGRRTLQYSDTDSKMLMNTSPLPDYIHNALAVAIEHRTLIIGGKEYTCEDTEYLPVWDKNSTLAPVEINLIKQVPRKLNTLC